MPEIVSAPCTRYASPLKPAGLPSSSGIITDRYSRRWRTGLSNDRPHIISTTIWCDSPMPSARRDGCCSVEIADCTVSACWASIIGCRG